MYQGTYFDFNGAQVLADVFCGKRLLYWNAGGVFLLLDT
jgi:hypothetical protein